jgi:peptide/nickel transport system substrate-binding protein
MRNQATKICLSLAAILAITACTPSTPRSQGPGGPEGAAPTEPQRTLVIAIRAEPPSIAARPLVPFTQALNTPLFLFNATLDYRDERDVPQPYLGEGLPKIDTDTWRLLPDGKMETKYTLKPNLTWQDGHPLSADDFVFAYEVYSTPALGAAASPPIGVMESVTAPDARTIVIRWKQLYPDAGVFYQSANTTTFQALPRHILEQPFKDLDPVAFTGLPFWSSEYIGLGPYKVEHWEPGTYIQARAFDGYVLGKPRIDRMEIRFIPDPQTAVANLLAGEVHFVSDFVLTVTDGQTLEQEWPQRGGGSVNYSPVSLRSSVVQLRPNAVETPALLDARVRRAIAFATDSAVAVDVLTAGKGLPTNTLTSPRVPYYGDIERVIQKYSYDPRRAQQLMEEAGYAKGADGFFAGADGTPVKYSVASSAGPKNESEAAAYVDGQRKAGLDTQQRVIPAAQLDDPEQRALLPGLQIRGGGNPLVTYTSEQIPRAENRWRGENRGGWNNPEYDRFFQAYTSSLADADRVKQIVEMERILTSELPVIPHFFGVETNPYTSALKGPIARQTPNATSTFLYVHQWQWVK